MRTNTEHILCQLLGDGRCSTGVVVNKHVFCSSKQSEYINAVVTVETFVFSVDKHFPEYRIDVFVLYRGAVLIEELADKLTV